MLPTWMSSRRHSPGTTVRQRERTRLSATRLKTVKTWALPWEQRLDMLVIRPLSVGYPTQKSCTRICQEGNGWEQAMSIGPHSENRLLSTLPPADFELLRRHLRGAVLSSQSVLCEPGDRVGKAY